MSQANPLEDFKIEVNRNRSAIFSKNFEETWFFLGLNPDLLKEQTIAPCRDWFDNVFNFFFLEQALKENSSNEIFLHNECSLQDHDLKYALENIALKSNQSWNNSSPYLSTKMVLNGEKFRLTLIHPQITSTLRPRAFLRRLKSSALSIETYIPHEVLKEKLIQKKNIIISGSTGSGKTTLVQSLLSLCNENEHLVILEDTHEIHLKNKNITQFLSDKNNSLVDFCSYALRVAPERIILGELRGEEILPLILAMNTGHNGFLTTIHADSAPTALVRLKTLLNFFAPQNKSGFDMICQNIDVIIHMENKKVTEIIEVKGMDENIPLYEYLFKSDLKQSCEVC